MEQEGIVAEHKECEQSIDDLRRRLGWEAVQKARLLDEIEMLRRHVNELQDRLTELEGD